MPQQPIVNPSYSTIVADLQGFFQGLISFASRFSSFQAFYALGGSSFPGVAYFTNGLSGITVSTTNSNHLYSGSPTAAYVAAPPYPGAQTATFTLAWGVGGAIGTAGSLTLASGGTGGTYAPNDVLTLATSGATVKVVTVSGSQIATWQLLTPGTGAVIASAVTTTGGGGTGATFNVTGLDPVAATLTSSVGAGYGVGPPPLITLTDSAGAGAVLVAVLANVWNPINLTPTQAASLQQCALDLGNLSQVIQGNGVVPYGDSKTITNITNAAPMVVTVGNNTQGMTVGQAVTISSVLPTAYNITSQVTALTNTTVTLNNGTAPGSSYTSGGLLTVINNATIDETGYPFLAVLQALNGQGF